MNNYPSKSKDESKRYGNRWKAALGELTLVGATISSSDPSFVITEKAFDDYRITFMVSGGRKGATTIITCLADISDGQKLEYKATLLCK